MFWFDKADPSALFVDIRSEVVHEESVQGKRAVEIRPDLVADFRSLPFPDDAFHLIVFDPPHLTRNGKRSRMALKYGSLSTDWQADIAAGFEECFRCLKDHGTLIFKWNETDINLSAVLKLTPYTPLFGHRSGKAQRTHWICFIKDDHHRYV